MRQDERAAFDRALEPVRLSAYAPGEFVGQQSFMRAGEILSLAVRAGVAPGMRVLDLCCGVAGPGRLITRELGCDYLGVDASASAVDAARELSEGLPCRFEVRTVPPLPPGPFDVVLLLETLLAFRDKQALLREVSGVLPVGGRFACTLEEGRPLTEAERRTMPDPDTVWPVPLADMLAWCEEAGLAVRWQAECSRSHLDTVSALVEALTRRGPEVCAQVGRRALDELLAGHRLWAEWLRTGRVRKFAVVAEKMPTSRPAGRRPARSNPRSGRRCGDPAAPGAARP